jgi:hypothetical protein
MKTPVSYTFTNVWAVVILRALDVFFACCIWRDYDVTISAWTGLDLRKPTPQHWSRILGWILNRIQPNHCELAIAADIERAQAALIILAR